MAVRRARDCESIREYTLFTTMITEKIIYYANVLKLRALRVLRGYQFYIEYFHSLARYAIPAGCGLAGNCVSKAVVKGETLSSIVFHGLIIQGCLS